MSSKSNIKFIRSSIYYLFRLIRNADKFKLLSIVILRGSPTLILRRFHLIFRFTVWNTTKTKIIFHKEGREREQFLCKFQKTEKNISIISILWIHPVRNVKRSFRIWNSISSSKEDIVTSLRPLELRNYTIIKLIAK